MINNYDIIVVGTVNCQNQLADKNDPTLNMSYKPVCTINSMYNQQKDNINTKSKK